MEHRCLFNGQAAIDLADNAPWVVHLEVGNTFTRKLFTDSVKSWDLWEGNTCLIFQSKAPIDGMLRHLRRFTRMRDNDGKWFFFRFRETGYLHRYLEHFSTTRPDLIRRLCLTRDDIPRKFITSSFRKQHFTLSEPNTDYLTSVPAAPFVLDGEERAFLRKLRDEQKTWDITTSLKKSHAYYLSDISEDEVWARVDAAKCFMRSLNIKDPLPVGRYILFSTVYLPDAHMNQSYFQAVTRPGTTPTANRRDYFDVLKLQMSRNNTNFKAWW